MIDEQHLSGQRRRASLRPEPHSQSGDRTPVEGRARRRRRVQVLDSGDMMWGMGLGSLAAKQNACRDANPEQCYLGRQAYPTRLIRIIPTIGFQGRLLPVRGRG